MKHFCGVSIISDAFYYSKVGGTIAKCNFYEITDIQKILDATSIANNIIKFMSSLVKPL